MLQAIRASLRLLQSIATMSFPQYSLVATGIPPRAWCLLLDSPPIEATVRALSFNRRPPRLNRHKAIRTARTSCLPSLSLDLDAAQMTVSRRTLRKALLLGNDLQRMSNPFAPLYAIPLISAKMSRLLQNFIICVWPRLESSSILVNFGWLLF